MPSTNVLFKKGVLSDLFASDGSIKSGVTVVNGALYFAMNKSDSGEERGKLYLGEDNKLVPIGEDVVLRTVSQISALPTASLHKGEFYYSENGNILAYSNGSQWSQVNSSARLITSSTAMTVSGTNNTATVGMEVTDQIGGDANSQHTVEGAFTLSGGSNVTITTSAQTITVSAKDTTYDMAATSAGTETVDGHTRSLGANINLTETGTATTTDTVKIKSTSSVVASVNANGEIELAVDTSGVGSITDLQAGTGHVQDDGTAVSGATGSYGFHYRAVSTTASYAGNIDPQITVKNAAGNALTAVHFVDGVAALDVFSTQAVVDKIAEAMEAANAMTYRGSASEMSDITGVSGGLHNGDVFIATEAFTIGNGYNVDNGNKVEPGYLVVVHGGTEDGTDGTITTPTSATYTVIKSNDTDTHYSVEGINGGMQFNEGDESIGTLTFSGGTSIDVTATSTTASQLVTISHATLTATNYTTTASSVTANYGNDHTATLSVVTGVTVNRQGHTTGVTVTPIVITDTRLTTTASTSVSAASNTATIAMTFSDTAENAATASFSLTSSSLEITNTGSQVAMNLIWGSF